MLGRTRFPAARTASRNDGFLTFSNVLDSFLCSSCSYAGSVDTWMDVNAVVVIHLLHTSYVVRFGDDKLVDGDDRWVV
jgi:hypothetical protein